MTHQTPTAEVVNNSEHGVCLYHHCPSRDKNRLKTLRPGPGGSRNSQELQFSEEDRLKCITWT